MNNGSFMFIVLWCIFLSLTIKSCKAKADDPNLKMPNCNLPTQQNVKDLKAIMKEIRTIASHPEMVYIRLHDKERENIKKRLPYEPNLELFLK